MDELLSGLVLAAQVSAGASSHEVVAQDLAVHLEPDLAGRYREGAQVRTPFPSGATIVAVHSTGNERGDAFVMRKVGSAWRFSAFGPTGDPRPVNEALCRRCHEEAPSDLVFGVGAPPSPPNPNP